MGAADELDVVVVGAGVVGLAVARALARAGRAVHVLEAEPRMGAHTSSRSSEVVHAGLYYPTGSHKARLCVRGRALLYAYCEARGVAHKRLGKLIVAAHAGEAPQLEALAKRARDNGVDDVTFLSGAEARRLEPALACASALYSPSTGIVDSHGLMVALLADARAAGATLVTRTPVRAVRRAHSGFTLEIGGDAPTTVRCRALINAAGLFAPRLAAAIEGLDPRHARVGYFAKGHYFTLAGPSPFARLVYPLPDAHGLGVHLTLDLAGRVRFGPDVAWVDDVDYAFDDVHARRARFAEAIRRYYPGLDAAALSPDYTGIRPKLGGAGSDASDFVIQGQDTHGMAGLVQLFGIESPGLTASLAIAEDVARNLT
ncbi:MAG: NAD(P)/FAD-dependent oxidoreductase [Polyangiales bacterium]